MKTLLNIEKIVLFTHIKIHIVVSVCESRFDWLLPIKSFSWVEMNGCHKKKTTEEEKWLSPTAFPFAIST